MPDLADDLNNLAMDPAAQPLLDAVKQHISKNVEPIVEELHALTQRRRIAGPGIRDNSNC